MQHKNPALTVDALIIDGGDIVLIKRKNQPFKDKWALPGGFVEYGECVEDAAVREAKEETGLDIILERLTGVYSDPDRDPRGHTVSVCFLGRIKGGELAASSDAKDVRAFPLDSLPPLAFDHARIISDFMVLR